MPLYMDIHHIASQVTMADVTQAHRADLEIQRAYDVRYLRSWVDEAFLG